MGSLESSPAFYKVNIDIFGANGSIGFETRTADKGYIIWKFPTNEKYQGDMLTIYDRRRTSTALVRNDGSVMNTFQVGYSPHTVLHDELRQSLEGEACVSVIQRRLASGGVAEHLIMDDAEKANEYFPGKPAKIPEGELVFVTWGVPYDRLVSVDTSRALWSFIRERTSEGNIQVGLAAITSSSNSVSFEQMDYDGNDHSSALI